MASDSNLYRNSPSFDSCSSVDADPRERTAQTAAGNPSSFRSEKFIWLNQVRADAELTPLAFMLAFVLANLVNEREGYAWPSVESLAAECHVTENGVKKVIRRLVERGHLFIELGGGRGNTNRYRWLIKTGSAICVEEDQDAREKSRCDEMEQAALPLLVQKGMTPVALNWGNRRCEKGQPQLPRSILKNLITILTTDSLPDEPRRPLRRALTTSGASTPKKSHEPTPCRPTSVR